MSKNLKTKYENSSRGNPKSAKLTYKLQKKIVSLFAKFETETDEPFRIYKRKTENLKSYSKGLKLSLKR